MGSLSTKAIREFQAVVRRQGRVHYRDLPWRPPSLQLRSDKTLDPYAVLVSEIMLQQTQVPRVIPKFEAFLSRFPTVQALASAPLGEVLKVWSGLGYNRRAKYLWQAARQIVAEFNGQIPRDTTNLQSLPGVGTNTAGALLAYAFNEPALFIETNIRTVFIHHFFKDQTNVLDKVLQALLIQTLKGQSPRTFYWALMDYGAYLKSTVGNVSRASASYTKQPKFVGSRRQIRGQVIQLLTDRARSLPELSQQISDKRLADVLLELESEGFIFKLDATYKVV